MTGKRTIQRCTTLIYDLVVEESDNGDFVVFEDHERIVSEMQHEVERLKNKCNSLWRVIHQPERQRCLSKDDLKSEVIE